jgi:hypothetical protein
VYPLNMDLLHFWVVFFFGNFQDHKIARLQLKFELVADTSME